MSYSRHMKDDATFWPKDGNDGFGGVEYGAPIVVKCRWQDQQVLARDAEGNEFTSSAIVYTDQALSAEGRLARGEFADATPVDSSREVRQVGESPNLRQTTELHKSWLG